MTAALPVSNPPKIFGRIRGLRKEFGGSLALDGIDLDLPAGELTVILGPSGCGKTTLLRILAGLAPADAGKVEFDGVVVNDPRSRLPSEKRRLGMVFQDALLWPHLRVRGNIAFPLGAGRTGDPRVVKAARAAEIEPVDWNAPELMRLSIEPSVTPRPTCAAFEPPDAAFAAAPARWVCESASRNVARLDLKPTVLTFARSFAVTSSMIW